LKVSLNPFEEKVILFPEIKVENPLLWWSNGIGNQPLYHAKFDFISQD